MNKYIVVFNNGDYLVTSLNGTIEEAKEYYLQNEFNVNESIVTVSQVYTYDAWKEKALQHANQNENVVLKFDDKKQEFTFITKYNDIVIATYDQLNLSMFQFEKATHTHYIDILSKVSSEQNFEFENEMYSYDSYQTSILEYTESFKEEETDLAYHEWLENYVSYVIIEGV